MKVNKAKLDAINLVLSSLQWIFLHGINANLKKNILSQGCTTGNDMIFAGIDKNELSVINVFPSIQCFCLNISEMNRIESTSYSVLITRGILR